MADLPCLSLQEALDVLHHCLESGEIVFGRHFRDALGDEQLTIEDVWAVLRSGAIYQAPDLDVKTGEWKYRVEGHEPGGKWLIVVFCFKTVDRTFLITVFSLESLNRRA